MKINKLILENIKCYTYKEYDFSDGLNFITGKNGNGKTTIIEAIGFAMFNYKIVSKNFSTYFVNIAAAKKTGKVKVYFTDKNEEEYLVERTISETQSKNMWTIKNIESGEVVAEKEAEVIPFIKEHIDISSHLDISNQFENIISVPQGKYVEGFDRTDEERKRLFDPIFNLDVYKKAASKIQIKKEVEEKINKLRVLEGVADTKVLALNESIIDETKLANEVDTLKTLVENTKIEKEKLEEYIAFQEKLKQDIEKDKYEIGKLNISLSAYEKELEKNNENIKDAKEATKICTENKENYLKYTKLEEKINSLEKDMEDLKEKETKKEQENSNLKIIENTYKITKDKIEELNENINQIKNTLKENENAKATAKEELENLNIEKNNLVVSNIAEEINKLVLAIRVKKSNNELQAKLIEFKDVEKEKEKLEKNLEVYKNVDSEKENCNIEITALEEKIKSENENIALMEKGICPITKNECTTIISKVNEKKENVESLEKQKEEKILNLKNILEKINNLEKLKEELINLDKKINEKNIISSRIEKEEEKYIKNNVEDLEQEKLELEASEKEKRNKETSIIAKISTLENEIKNIEKQEVKENKNLVEKEKSVEEETIKLEELNKSKEEKEVCIKKIEEYILENADLKSSLTNFKKEKEAFKTAYNEYIKNETVANKLETYRKIETDIKLSIETTDKDISNINTKINEAQSNLDIEKLEVSKKEEKEIISDLATKQEKLEKILETQKVNIENIEKLKNLNINKNKIMHNIEVYRKVITELENYQVILKNISTNIAIILLDQISTEANKIYIKIMQDGTFLRWGDKYELTVTEKLGDTVIVKQFKQLSGGEQMSASIAIRLAMIQRLSNVSLGILDEPSINLDEEKRERLAEVINEFKEICNQLFVVSHDSTFDDYIDYQIEVSK